MAELLWTTAIYMTKQILARSLRGVNDNECQNLLGISELHGNIKNNNNWLGRVSSLTSTTPSIFFTWTCSLVYYFFSIYSLSLINSVINQPSKLKHLNDQPTRMLFSMEIDSKVRTWWSSFMQHCTIVHLLVCWCLLLMRQTTKNRHRNLIWKILCFATFFIEKGEREREKRKKEIKSEFAWVRCFVLRLQWSLWYDSWKKLKKCEKKRLKFPLLSFLKNNLCPILSVLNKTFALLTIN